MIGTTLIGILFFFSHRQALASYRSACYQILDSEGKTVKILFKDSVNFHPESFEMFFHRIEKSNEDITIFEQQHSVKVKSIGETCDETLEVGRLTLHQTLKNYLNIMLYFGEQKYVLDEYKFTLSEQTPDGLYTIDGIYDHSLIQIRVVNAKSTFKEYYYDGRFYHQETEFVQSAQYCLKLWHKYPGKQFYLKFPRKFAETLPQFVTVSFNVMPGPDVIVTDLGHLSLCSGDPLVYAITMQIQQELTKGTLRIQLFDPKNKLVAQTLLELPRLKRVETPNECVLINIGGWYMINLPFSLEFLEENVVFHEGDFKTHKCESGGKKCAIDEYRYMDKDVYTQGVCETSFDSTSHILFWKRFPKTEYERCLSKSRV